MIMVASARVGSCSALKAGSVHKGEAASLPMSSRR